MDPLLLIDIAKACVVVLSTILLGSMISPSLSKSRLFKALFAVGLLCMVASLITIGLCIAEKNLAPPPVTMPKIEVFNE